MDMKETEGGYMKKRNAVMGMLIPVLSSVLLMSGCATVDRKVNLHYEVSAPATGGSGELYVAQEGGHGVSGAETAVQWIMGKIQDTDGKHLANIVTPTAPTELMTGAFKEELKAAGYRILPVTSLPADVAKGIVFGNITIALDEVSSFVKADAKCTAKVSAEIWRDGSRITKLDYETIYNDSAVTDRDRILQDTLQRALQNLMKRAVPEIIKALER